jgi:hypothetical protein
MREAHYGRDYEKINFEVCRAFEEQGIRFSLPLRVASTSVHSEEKPVEVKLTNRQPAA